MNKNEQVALLALQTYAIVAIGIRCNGCELERQTSYPQTALAAYQLANEGWTTGENGGRVWCPKCKQPDRPSVGDHAG